MSAATATHGAGQAPKFSRYRSVRKAVATAAPEEVPALPVLEASDSQLNRVPSRYHRATRQRTQTLPTQPIPSQPVQQALLQSKPVPTQKIGSPPSQKAAVRAPIVDQSSSSQDDNHHFNGGPVQAQPVPKTSARQHIRNFSRTLSNAARPTAITSPKSYDSAREEARMILEGEYDRIQKVKMTQKKPGPKEDSVVLKRDRRPTQTQQPKPEPAFYDAPKLNVKRKVERHMPEKFYDAPQTVGQRPPSPERATKPKTNAEYKHEPAAPKMTPGDIAASAPRHFDAPISAVNAGDRRVEVRFGNASRGITLPVTPTTNSKDLLNSASIVMSEDFNPRTSILVESFQQVGLERPLRRYEHIRDVMNSWDADDQNYLTIMTESQCLATGLERSEAPTEEPQRLMVQMYLSQRPGKWEKKWVILRSDGQVTMSKYENDGDATNICHLSDFDVYSPTQKQRKKLKPPRKICFAVKSQQKSAMFLEGLNFVHFFATGDKQVADQWYNAVQSWRSWYLVNVLGEGTQKPKENTDPVTTRGLVNLRPSTGQSTDSVPYQLGSFQPLLDLGDLGFGSSQDNDKPGATHQINHISRKASLDLGFGRRSVNVNRNDSPRRGSRQKGKPPSSFPAKFLSEMENRGRPSLDNSDDAFTGGGLLARSSSRRSQSAGQSGHARQGSRGKPLVDLTGTSEFAEGSLLRKLEAWDVNLGEHEPKIDRQKRVEADVKVGEGLY